MRHLILACPERHATSSYLVVNLLWFLLGGVELGGVDGNDTAHVSCFAIESSFILDVMLLDLVLPLLLRYLILACPVATLIFDAKLFHLILSMMPR